MASDEMRALEAVGLAERLASMLEILESDLLRLSSAAIDHALYDFTTDRAPFQPMSEANEHALELAASAVQAVDKVKRMLAKDVRPHLADLVTQERDAGASPLH